MDHTLHPIEKEEVMAYLDGELPVERAAVVAAHFEQCKECQGLAAELRFLSEQLAAWQVEPSPARVTEQVTAAIKERAEMPRASEESELLRDESGRDVPRKWGWALGMAGVLAALLVIAAISTPNLLRSRLAVNQTRGPYGTANKDQEGVANSALQSGSAAPQSFSGPMIIRTASLTLVAKEFDSARTTIERIVLENRGYVAQLNVTAQAGSGRVLAATLRVPSDRLGVVLGELKKLGRVERESQAGEEVTAQYVDLVARLSNARNTEQRLIEVLRERTGKVADILAVEREVARVREEIERMEAERKNMENRVGLATVQVQASEEYKAELEMAPLSTGTQLWNAAVDGYRTVTSSIVGVALFVLSYGPMLLFWSLLLFWPARLSWRRLRA
jgi:hypothetical protein